MSELESESVPISGPTREERNRWLFDCKRCFGKFETKHALEEHLKRRLFKCPFRCKASFVHKDELKTHEKVCTNRLKNSSFDCYKIYNMINLRHSLTPRKREKCLPGLNLWVRYPYWFDRPLIDNLGLPVPINRLLYEESAINNKILKNQYLKYNTIQLYKK